jgi:hypothetical protein
MVNNLASIELSLENLLNEPFMSITSGLPSYEIDHRAGPKDYGQVNVWLQIHNIRPDVMEAFNADYDLLGLKFAEWAKSKGFVDCQILGGDDMSLCFEITAVSSD